MADGTLQLIMSHLKAFISKKVTSRFAVALTTVLILCSGCNRVYKELLAWDCYEDIFFDVGEGDSNVGFTLLHGRWKSYQPTIYPNTENMRTARRLAGCCLLLRFWDRLSVADRQQIIADNTQPNHDSDYEDELKQLVLTKVQIQSNGLKSLTSEQLKFWNKTSGNFGNQSRQ